MRPGSNQSDGLDLLPSGPQFMAGFTLAEQNRPAKGELRLTEPRYAADRILREPLFTSAGD